VILEKNGMILEYHRPKKLEEAINLLARDHPETIPMGGGTDLSRASDKEYAVVDLQALGLNEVIHSGNYIELGPTVTLQQVVENGGLEPALREAAEHEAPLNLRNVKTVAGVLISADGTSPFVTALMAMDGRISWLLDEAETGIGDWLPIRRDGLPGKLLRKISLPAQAHLSFEMVARTPQDAPIVCAAIASWPSGRVRAVLGGYGSAPLMVFDGNGSIGVEIAARSAYSQAADPWASADYRAETAQILVRRCLHRLEAK
jgi:CO/xanthine dehydrogenase FAD-binding subunit